MFNLNRVGRTKHVQFYLYCARLLLLRLPQRSVILFFYRAGAPNYSLAVVYVVY